MYKMVVLDLDGTLLNDKKQISRRNAEVIKKVHKEKGVLFNIKDEYMLKNYFDEIDAIKIIESSRKR